jgi:hypothetical protein
MKTESSSLQIEEANRLVSNLLQLLEKKDTDADELKDIAMQTLNFLWDQTNLLADLAGGYPRKGGIRADVWSDGVELAQLGKSLGEAFRGLGMTELEEIATSIWTKATLQVQSHYHHIVGPAMLANADCNERLGRRARAADLYEAIIGDFRWLVDEWESEVEAPSEQDALSLEVLSTALKRRASLGGDADAIEVHRALLARLEPILRRQQ